MIGSAIAATISVSTGITANAIGVGGLPGILSIKPKFMLLFALAMVLVIIVPFVLTVIVGKKKGIGNTKTAAIDNTETSAELSSKQIHKLGAFLEGNTVAIEDVPDAVFSSKTLGDGMAIEP